MRKIIAISVCLPFLLAGSTGQTQRPSIPVLPIDTTMMRRMADSMVTSWAEQRARQFEQHIPDKQIIGHIDYEPRPDGRLYAWIWRYKVRGRDTVYDTTIIRQIR